MRRPVRHPLAGLPDYPGPNGPNGPRGPGMGLIVSSPIVSPAPSAPISWDPIAIYGSAVRGYYDARNAASVANIAATWNDLSPLARNLTTAGSGTPALIAADPNFNSNPSVETVGGPYFLSPTYANEAQPCTYIAVLDRLDLSDGLFAWEGNGVAGLGLFTSGGTYWASGSTQVDSGYGSTIVGSTTGITPPQTYLGGEQHIIEIVYNGASTTVTIDKIVVATLNAGSSGRTGLALATRHLISSFWKGRFGMLLILNIIRTAPQKLRDETALIAAFSNFAQVIHVGDSLTLGRDAVPLPTFVGLNETVPYGLGADYPSRMRAQLDLTYPLKNYGAGGAQIGPASLGGPTPSMLHDIGHITPLFNATRAANILCLWGGINDVAANRAAADIRADQVTYVQTAQAAGWTVIIGTIAAATVSAPQEVVRLAANALMSANAEGLTAPLVDVAANPNFLASNITNPLIYNPDETHYTNLGYNILASLWAPYVASAIIG